MNLPTAILLTSLFLVMRPAFSETRALQPVAQWSLDALEPLDAVGNLRVAEDGPTSPQFPAMPSRNPAIAFDGTGTFVRVADEAALRFDNGDSITIEAWINGDTFPNGQHAYVIGKGRTEADRDNQNWALRLTGVGGEQARISFLFRSRADGTDAEAFHRWTSTESFSCGDWYHVAIRYTFGQPKSLRGFIDGVRVPGKWDMGGKTSRAPVIDGDAVWIGSARGGDPANSFHGRLDSIAIYRELLPDDAIAQRAAVAHQSVSPQLDAVPPGKVLAEIYDAAGSPQRWPRLQHREANTLALESLALLSLPHIYADGGVRADRKLPLFVRLAAPIALPAGEYDLLFRAPGYARLLVDGEPVATIDPFTLPRDGHNPLRPQNPAEADPHLPRLPLGCRQTRVAFRSTGKSQLLVCESLLGKPGIRFTVNPLLVAYRARQGGPQWNLLGPQPLPFTPDALEKYHRRQAAAMASLDDRRRAAAQEAVAVQWGGRRQEAREFLRALPELPLPGNPGDGDPIDRFLLAKIEAAGETASEAPGPAAAHQALSLLQDRCFRCHGEKAKGGLQLSGRDQALLGGDSGEAALVPGHPDRSALIRRVRSSDEEERMPPKGERLTPAESQLLQDWISEGADWPNLTRSPLALPPRAAPLTFLRRLYLDTVGILPPAALCRRILEDAGPIEWGALIDELLEDSRHADHWVSYWQDVLAENPRLVKGKLNNTGPFRWWIYDSLRDNKPFDQFVTELVELAGSKHAGGAGGFGIATQNDVPMAAKAHVIGTAFLGREMKCARCHDAPYHSAKQRELFSIAAMLENEAITLPQSSTIPASFFQREREREPLVQATLAPGMVIESKWPYTSHATSGDGRRRLAAEIIHPANRRFAKVIVNRIWKRYFGQGIVEPVHDWEQESPSHPALLEYLAREFVASGHDLRHIHRLILKSQAYQREALLEPAGSAENRFFQAPLRRRVSAEQLVDSLFAASGVPFYSEELSFDPEGAHPPDVMQSLGTPRRAWQLNAISSERDRPSLTLPKASSLIAVMEAFGWRSNRSEPIQERALGDDVRQPGMLGNGLFGVWLTRLSDYSALTGMAVAASSPAELVDALYLRFLTRPPTPRERADFVALLAPGFAQRLTDPKVPFAKKTYVPEVREVTWSNHLNAAANRLAARTEERVSQGPPPSGALQPDWRERLEDLIWALINSPEMQFLP